MTSSVRLAIFAAAFWLIAAVSSQTLAISLPLVIRLPKANALQNNLRFIFKNGADGKTSTGADFSAVSYESSDGTVVTAITEYYSSKHKAEKALQKKLRGATRILSRAPKFARTGRRVGTRIVATFRPEDEYASPANIFWTDGSELHHLGSVSLRHVREFEKSFY